MSSSNELELDMRATNALHLGPTWLHVCGCVSGVWCLASGVLIWCPGVCCMAKVAQCLVCGVWCMMMVATMEIMVLAMVMVTSIMRVVQN